MSVIRVRKYIYDVNVIIYDNQEEMFKDFNTTKFRKDFVKFVDEYDERRNLNFSETFPELMPMYNETKKTLND